MHILHQQSIILIIITIIIIIVIMWRQQWRVSRTFADHIVARHHIEELRARVHCDDEMIKTIYYTDGAEN
jgi:FtsZ-interacting cell division protein ZipA